MSRIETAAHLIVLWAFALTVLLTYGCGASRSVTDHGPRGTVRFKCNQSDAVVMIDEVRVGPVGMLTSKGVLLKPGTHRIIVQKEGYFREYRLIDVVKDEVQVVNMELTAIPD